MLKPAKPKKGGVGVGGDSRAGHGRSKVDRSEIDNVEGDGNEFEVDEVGKKGRKMSKSKNLSKFKKTVVSDFFTPRAKLTFIELRQAFLKTPILYHFDLECYIRIETDVSSYAIGEVFSQLTSDDSSQ